MNPLISAVVGVSIVIASTVIVINTVTPVEEQTESLAKLNNAKQVINTVDQAIKDLALEAPGAKRSLTVKTDMPLIISDTLNKVFVRFDLDKPLFEPGSQVEEGPVTITSGPANTVKEEDINNDGQIDYVMENDNLIFAVKKIGSEGSPESLNTEDMVSYVRNKVENIDMPPRSSRIFINDDDSSYKGTGYTEMAKGSTSVAILVHVNSNADINYTAVFTLRPAVDFVEMTVRDIEI